MRQRIIDRLPRFLLMLLLSFGLTFPFLGALHVDVSLSVLLLPVLIFSLLLEGISLSRRASLFGAIGLLLCFLIWLAGSGFSLLSDVFRAFTLQLSGVPGAMPLVARETALVFALFFTLISFLCTRPLAGSLGAILLTLMSLLLLWLADRTDLVPRLLPAAIAAICLLLLERHPELSFPRAFPWVVALTLLAYGFTPRTGVVFSPLKDSMDTLRQSVMDRLFFTEPRDVFSLSKEGFYPQGVSQLGGPVNPSDHPVMQVSTPRTAYLRGVLMNEYDGRSWRNTLGGRRYLWDASGVAGQRALVFNQNLPQGELASALPAPSEVSVRMLAESASTLFTPQRVQALRTGGELVPYFTNSSELFVTRNLQEGDTWSVSAPLMMAGDPGLQTLIDAAGNNSDPEYRTIQETYTALPSHLEEPVWLLAAEITAGIDSPYEKAFALQNYLSRNYRYTLSVDYQPTNIDFVTHFLFNTRQGYCTYFASALTVLCRMVGLPARYVEGYLAQPNAQGEALVTGRNAHAWTEVYFQGFGWLTFDATPRQESPNAENQNSSQGQNSLSSPETEIIATPPPDNELTSAEPLPQEETSPDPNLSDEQDPTEPGLPVEEVSPGEKASFPWLLLLLMLLLASVCALWIRWLWTAPKRKAKHATQEIDQFDLWLKDVLSRLSAAGYSRQPGETLMAFTRRLERDSDLSVSLNQLGECASLLHYGRVQPLATDVALARDLALQLKKTLPRKARFRYALLRLRGAASFASDQALSRPKIAP